MTAETATKTVRFVKEFPFAEMRPQQRAILEGIDREWDSKRYFIVDAPTGVGKSGVAMAVMRSNVSYLLTSTKILQDQYESEFPNDAVSIKGQGNYDCSINPLFKVDHAPCKVLEHLVKKCIDSMSCPYYTQRSWALSARTMLTSYAYFLMSAECGPLSKLSPTGEYDEWRPLMVCDEAHELEQHLVQFATSDLIPDELHSKYGVGVDPGMTFWDDANTRTTEMQARDVHSKVLTRLKWYNDKIKEAIGHALEWSGGDPKRMSKHAAHQIRGLTKERDVLDRMNKRLKLWAGRAEDEPWVMKPILGGKGLQLTPLRPRRVFREYMSPLAGKFIFMSASMGDPKTLMDELGLDPAETAVLSTGTDFDPDKSPIYPLQYAGLGYRDINQSIPDVLDIVRDLLELHEDDKGIIHAGNYKLTKAILDNLDPSVRGRLIGKPGGAGRSNEELVKLHTESPSPTVLVSPSMYTGIDLRDDLSRFQIIVKLPWANTMDPRAEAKLRSSPGWYSNQMWQRIIQAAGRSTRSSSDHSATYIIDRQFLDVYNRDRTMLPKWFCSRIKWEL